jgi:hypothetical protein
MPVDRSNFVMPQPTPGEIWEVNCDGAIEDEPGLSHYVQIIRESQADLPASYSVMLLSIETQYLSNVDILIPPAISGLDRDLLAETWNVGTVSIDRLQTKVGNRLSRQIYDLLLSIGDLDRDLNSELPTVSEIRSVGLLILPDRIELNDPQIVNFHQRERLLLCSWHPTAMDRVAKLVDRLVAIDREFTDIVCARTSLSDWFQNSIAPQWQTVKDVSKYAAISIRNASTDSEINNTISQIVASNDEDLRRQLIHKLGSISGEHNTAITALVNLIQTTTNDETLWIVVDSLRRVAPTHPSAGIRRLKSVDLGESVKFVINIIPKSDNRLGILLQVYPETEMASLPANLKLVLQDEDGKSLREVVAGAADDCIQLKLSGLQREIFSVCLKLDEIESIEDFVI